MNSDKIDPFLLSEMGDIIDPNEEILEVFIKANRIPDRSDINLLKKIGLRNIPKDRKIFTATLSAKNISLLADISWITSIKLSRKLHPLFNENVHAKNRVA